MKRIQQSNREKKIIMTYIKAKKSLIFFKKPLKTLYLEKISTLKNLYGRKPFKFEFLIRRSATIIIFGLK